MQKARLALLASLSFVTLACKPEPPPPPPACADGLDSDGDAFIDEADPGCLNAEDNDELDAQCADGLDNDFDGLADGADAECAANPNAEANLAALPDLRLSPDQNAAFGGATPLISFRDVAADDPELLEGCFTGTGNRKILEWNSIIENIGDADLIVGNTDPHQPPYTFNQNLGALQFEGWTRSFLVDAQGATVGEGHKGSFCMLDLSEVAPGSCNGKFGDCFDGQGITAGCGDVYSIGLPCQFIDITDVPTGADYTLRVEVNFTRELPEKDYSNNAQEYQLFIP
jgi:hypothetical protein